MYEARYYKRDGSAGSSVSLPTSLFDGVVNEGALHQVIKAYQANQRQGTASAKSRGQVAGGSRKPWRQKGTGRARQGTIRAVQWAGGGVAFPPKPHSWNQKVTRKMRALARRSAFNDRAEAGRVVIIEGFDIDAPKTRRLTTLLEAMETEGKVLVLTDGLNQNVHLSGRNLPEVHVRPFGTESPYDIIWSGTVVIEETALKSVPDASDDGQSPRRRSIDPEKMAEAAEEQAARAAARARPRTTRRLKGDEIDTGAPLVGAETGTAAASPRPTKKVEKKAEKPAEREAAPEEAAAAPAAEAPVEAAAPAEEPTPAAEAPTPPDAPAPEGESDFDADAVDLPKVADLADFLAGIEDVTHVEALRDRDSRKTAAPIYAARIEELS